jgi:hypothetical protein
MLVKKTKGVPDLQDSGGGGDYPQLTCSCRAEAVHTRDSVFNVALGKQVPQVSPINNFLKPLQERPVSL